MRVQGEELRLSPGDFVTVNDDVSHEIFDGERDGLQIIFSVDPALLRKEKSERYLFSTVGEGALDREDRDALAFRDSVAKLAWMVTPDPAMLEKAMLGRETWEEPWDPGRWILGSEPEWYAYHREVYQCLFLISSHKVRGGRERDDLEGQDLFRRLVERIHREYAAPLNADVLGRDEGVSEPTVYRMFQKHLGMSLSDYIRLVRISAARNMLEQTDMEVTEIAFASGFSSLSNFYRVFRDMMGQAPKEYRRQKRQGGRNTVAGEMRPGLQWEIMGMNRFQTFFELPYDRDDILAFSECGKVKNDNIL